MGYTTHWNWRLHEIFLHLYLKCKVNLGFQIWIQNIWLQVKSISFKNNMKNSEVSKIWMILPRSIVIVLICTTTYKAVFKGPLPKVYWIFFGTLTYGVHKLMPKCAFFDISWKICPKILSYMYHLCFEIRSYQIL